MIRGKTREIVKSTIDLGVKIHNRFDIEVIDAATGEVKQRAQAENIILDQMWKNFRQSTFGWAYRLAYGDGTGVPTKDRTALFHHVGSKSTTGSSLNDDDVNKVIAVTRHIELGLTEAVGVELTEVGLANFDGVTISTHAMLKDMNGNQISILKTNLDIIKIYTTVFCHYAGLLPHCVEPIYTYNSDIISPCIGSAVTFPYEGGGSYTLRFSTRTGGALTGPTINSIKPVTDIENKTVTYTLPRLGVDTGNGRGIYRVYSYYSSSYSIKGFYIKLDAPFYNGSDITGESIGSGDGLTTQFSTVFLNVSDAIIYIDGVEQTSGVTVTKSTTETLNVEFDTPPALGAVITADYHTTDIAKDENHVLDLSFVVSYGEYTP